MKIPTADFYLTGTHLIKPDTDPQRKALLVLINKATTEWSTTINKAHERELCNSALNAHARMISSFEISPSRMV